MVNNYIDKAAKDEDILSAQEEVTTYYAPSENELRISFSMGNMERADIEAISAQVTTYVRYLLNYDKKDLAKPSTQQMTLEQAKKYLHAHRLTGKQQVPDDFNGMRDEVNPKYLKDYALSSIPAVAPTDFLDRYL